MLGSLKITISLIISNTTRGVSISKIFGSLYFFILKIISEGNVLNKNVYIADTILSGNYHAKNATEFNYLCVFNS